MAVRVYVGTEINDKRMVSMMYIELVLELERPKR